MHADRTNRLLLGLIGLVAVALGVSGLLAAGGVFGSVFQHRRLLDNQFSRYFGDHGGWLWLAIAGACLIILVIAVIWLLRLLFSTDRSSAIDVQTPTSGGRTRVQSSALTQAVAEEISTYHGVNGAKARVIGDAQRPTLVIAVSLSLRADLPGTIRRIEGEAITHARDALEQPELAVKLDITVSDKKVARTA